MTIADINVDVPVSPTAYTADIRDNWSAIVDVLQDHEQRITGGVSPDFLPLTGGSLSGPLQLPNGGLLQPALTFGMIDGTGFYRVGGTVGLALQGNQTWLFNPGITFCRVDLDLGGHYLNNVADALNTTDALNRRTGDARYAPVALVQEVAQLRAEVASLRRLVPRDTGQLARGMRTDVLAPPA
jgi:hypothetical protein